jgi:hypothetical protein
MEPISRRSFLNGHVGAPSMLPGYFSSNEAQRISSSLRAKMCRLA